MAEATVETDTVQASDAAKDCRRPGQPAAENEPQALRSNGSVAATEARHPP